MEECDNSDYFIVKFHPNLPSNVYKAFAWNGLMGNGDIDYQTGLKENSTAAWENLSTQERIDIINTINKFRHNHPLCGN